MTSNIFVTFHKHFNTEALIRKANPHEMQYIIKFKTNLVIAYKLI